VIKEDPKHENVLFTGMYRALYVSVDRGKIWSQVGTGMPATAVSDIEVDDRTRDLVVSTHGRGVYKIGLRAFDEWLERGMPQEDRVFAPSQLKAPDPEKLPDDSNSMVYEKVPFTFWQSDAGEVTLSLVNDSSKVVWSHKMAARKGFNQYRWDMILKRHVSPLPYFLGANEYVKKGRYTLRIAGKNVVETALVIE
jgi:hypothetical protein